MTKTQSKTDLVLVHGVTDDGAGYEVLRKRDERVELGTMRPIEHGKPLHGEVIRLTPREESPLLFDAKVELPSPGENASSKRAAHALEAHGPGHPGHTAERHGPAQVATSTYRSNWERVWGRAPKGPSVLN